MEEYPITISDSTMTIETTVSINYSSQNRINTVDRKVN